MDLKSTSPTRRSIRIQRLTLPPPGADETPRSDQESVHVADDEAIDESNDDDESDDGEHDADNAAVNHDEDDVEDDDEADKSDESNDADEDDEDDKDDEDDADENNENEDPPIVPQFLVREPPFPSYPASRQEEFLRRRQWFVETSPDYPPLRRQVINPRFLRQQQRGQQQGRSNDGNDADAGADSHPDPDTDTANNNVDDNNKDNPTKEESIDSFNNDNNTSNNTDADDEEAILSDSTDSLHNLHQQNQIGQGDGQNQNDDSSLSTVDFEGVDFAPILADLELIRQNGRIRGSSGSYYSVDSNFQFNEEDIRFTVVNYPGTFLRQYFGGPFPNFHWWWELEKKAPKKLHSVH